MSDSPRESAPLETRVGSTDTIGTDTTIGTNTDTIDTGIDAYPWHYGLHRDAHLDPRQTRILERLRRKLADRLRRDETAASTNQPVEDYSALQARALAHRRSRAHDEAPSTFDTTARDVTPVGTTPHGMVWTEDSDGGQWIEGRDSHDEPAPRPAKCSRPGGWLSEDEYQRNLASQQQSPAAIAAAALSDDGSQCASPDGTASQPDDNTAAAASDPVPDPSDDASGPDSWESLLTAEQATIATDSHFGRELGRLLEDPPPLVRSDLRLTAWLRMLSEETDPVHARAAAALYLQISRGWFVLPRGSSPAPQWTRNYSSATDADTQVTAEIARLVAAGHLLDWDDAQAQFPHLQGKDRPTICLALGFVQKTVDGRVKVRMVLDASAPHDGTSLNDTIDVPPTRLPSVRKIEAALADLGDGSYIWKVDLRDAFHLQPTAAESVDHLGIYWHGRFYVYAKMPFGIASAPSAMQTFSCAIMRAAMRRMTAAGLTCGPMPGYDHHQHWADQDDSGADTTATAGGSSGPPLSTSSGTAKRTRTDVNVHLHGYLDDFIGLGSDKASADLSFQTFVAVCDELFGIKNVQDKPGKTVRPCRQCEALGIIFDCAKLELRLSESRVANMLSTLSALRQRTHVTVRELQSAVGVLQFCSIVLPAAVPYYRQLLNALRELGARPRGSQRLPMTAAMISDVDMWTLLLGALNQRPVRRPVHQSVERAALYTDASLLGWGYFWGGRYRFNRWPPEWSAHFAAAGNWEISINTLESIALLLALRDVLPFVGGAHADFNTSLVCFIDNQSVMHMTGKLSSRAPHSLRVMKEIAFLSTIYGVTLLPRFVRSADNSAADILSRLLEPDVTPAQALAVMRDWTRRHPDATHRGFRPVARPDLWLVLEKHARLPRADTGEPVLHHHRC
ncbi:MAG TPA: hypothetical protein EYM39_01275 [Candidatus Latescibacteria bacterium]|nr:hypothetical protein [Candidatus Latescibacterota bacterium]